MYRQLLSLKLALRNAGGCYSSLDHGRDELEGEHLGVKALWRVGSRFHLCLVISAGLFYLSLQGGVSAGEQIGHKKHCTSYFISCTSFFLLSLLSKRGVGHRPGALYSVCTPHLLRELRWVALHFSALFLLSEIVCVLLGIGEVVEKKAPN